MKSYPYREGKTTTKEEISNRRMTSASNRKSKSRGKGKGRVETKTREVRARQYYSGDIGPKQKTVELIYQFG
jgi:hypothetical protein